MTNLALEITLPSLKLGNLSVAHLYRDLSCVAEYGVNVENIFVA